MASWLLNQSCRANPALAFRPGSLVVDDSPIPPPSWRKTTSQNPVRIHRLLPPPSCFRACLLLGALTIIGPVLRPTLSADPLKCDLAGYTAVSGLTAAVANDLLTIT